MDIDASNWNEDDASNIMAAPDGAPEGMAPSGVNNVLRAIMGALKRRRNQQAPKTTGGTASAYTLSYTVAPGALVDGMTHVVEFHAANNNAATLNVNSLGAIPVHYYSAGTWRTLPPGLLGANEIGGVAYHSSSGSYRLIGRPDTTGDWVPTGRMTARAGTILAYGQVVSRTEYAGLFAAYSTTYGTGDGSTTFNLPDLRGRVVAGKDDMGGSSANRLTSPINGDNLGAAGGTEGHTHSVSGSTSGSLSVSVSGTTGGNTTGPFGAAGGGFNVAVDQHTHGFTGTGSTSGSLSVFGTAASGSSVQPTIIANYAIYL